MINTSTSIPLSEQFRAVIAVNIRSPAMWASYAFFLGLPAILVILPVLLGQDWAEYMSENWHLLIVGPLLAVVGFPLMWLWTLHSHRKASPSSQGTQSYRIDDRGVELFGALYRTSLDWAAITRVVETSEFFLLYFGKQAAYFLPKRVLGEPERNQVRELARANVRGKVLVQRKS
jgi:hypothetical protein